MLIRMLTLQAGPAVVREAGRVYDVPTAEAKALIAGGYAVEAVTRQEPVERATRVTTNRRGRIAEEPAADSDEKE